MSDAHELHLAAERRLHPPTPVPLPVPDGWPVMDSAAWHGPAGDVAQGLHLWTEADPVAVLVSLLVAFGNMVGGGPHTSVGFSRHPGRVFACIVGDTAKARKGTSWDTARGILELVQDGGWLAKRVVSGLASGEGLIGAVRDPELGESGEPLPNTGAEDKRLLAVEEEFARVLAVAKREANTISPIVRAAYDSGNLNVLTKARQVATGAHISILGHITTEELRTKLTSNDVSNGFANRFLWVLARRPHTIDDPKRPPSSLIGPMASSFSAALDQAYQHQMLDLQRTPSAVELWSKLYRKMAADTPTGILGNLTARPEAHTLRLAVIYALLDRATEINAEHLAAAWAVWSYSRASVERIWADPLDGISTEARKLLDAIRAAGANGMSFSEQSGVFHNHLPKAALERARIEIDQVIVTAQVASGGRPKEMTWAIEYGPPQGEVTPIRAKEA